MPGVIAFCEKWASLIGDMFAKYPLAAAVITAVAVLVFVTLERQRNVPTKKAVTSVTHAFVVLVGWAILVPILGTVFDIALWFAKALLSAAEFVAHAYSNHPFFVLSVALVTALAYVVCEWRFKPRRPTWRAVVAVVAALAVIGLIVPVLDALRTTTVKDQAAAGASPGSAQASSTSSQVSVNTTSGNTTPTAASVLGKE